MPTRASRALLTLLVSLLIFNCALVNSSFARQTPKRTPPARASQFDVIIKGGTVYDGSGRAPIKADVGIRADRIAAVGNLAGAKADTILDATGLAVTPGFINMLSWS